MEYQVEEFVTEDGRSPFADAVRKMRDLRAVDKIDTAVRRMEKGNFGDHTGVGEGVNEVRIHYAKGYRVYYGLDGDTLVLLLNTGDKSSQQKDIDAAKQYWQDYKRRKKE